jgi:hypothetical protein
MSEQYPAYPAYASGAGVAAPEPPPPAPRAATEGFVADLRAAGVLVGVLAVIGALLGVVWSAWSGPQQRAFVIAPGRLYPYDEVETMAAGDGRYLVLVAAVGLLAGLFMWLRRPVNRGPVTALALVVGGLVGSALTWWVGYLTGGGTYDGKAGTTIAHLPLTLHMPALLVVEPALAALLYGMFVAFAARDDLGRDDPVRPRRSVDVGDHLEHGGGDGDAPGALQQGDLPPQ